MNRLKIAPSALVAACALAAGALGAGEGPAASVDFAPTTGAVRPALHSSGFGPTICSQTAQDLADMKSMGFAFARTHDWALINPNQRVCDYFHIFPLMHLDAKDPKNYVFGPTDYLLKRTREEAGLEVFFRMGTSIEHSGFKTHFNALIPEDFDKMAEIFAGTVRHYNRGWANGHKWNIRYWEIWNEPDGIENMWFPPEGLDGLRGERTDRQRVECRRKFVAFYVTVLKRLKAEFGDTIKVGGPAMCGYKETWFDEILAACRAEGVQPDFISWHGYTNDPLQFNEEAEKARALCDKYGFAKCELIVNEWHYFGYDDYGWADMQRCSDPKVKARIWTGPRSHNGIHSACFALATLANMQRSKLDQGYYYGCRHTGSWGFKDELQAKYKVFYALQAFGEIAKGYSVLGEVKTTGPLTTLVAKSADGRRTALLAVDYGGPAGDIVLAAKNVPGGRLAARVLDHTRDLAPVDVRVEADRLVLPRADANSAAYLLVWER